jgi:hypothetical protein
MKTVAQATIVLCMVFLFQKGKGQNDFQLNGKAINTSDLIYENATLEIEIAQLTEAYKYLEQKVEKLKSEAERYIKAIQECSIVSSGKSFSCANAYNSSLECGDAFLETIVPASFTENAIITYFIPKDYNNANLNISDLNGKSLLDFNIDNTGYGQITIPAGKLKNGIYDYCLLVDNRKMDCKKMIVLK